MQPLTPNATHTLTACPIHNHVIAFSTKHDCKSLSDLQFVFFSNWNSLAWWLYCPTYSEIISSKPQPVRIVAQPNPKISISMPAGMLPGRLDLIRGMENRHAAVADKRHDSHRTAQHDTAVSEWLGLMQDVAENG